MNFAYDDDADVLYVTFLTSPGPCRYYDTPSGAILRIVEATGQVASATIQFFSRRAEHGELDFPELENIGLSEAFLRSISQKKRGPVSARHA